MKKVYYYVIGAAAFLAVTFSTLWIVAVNGEVRKRNDVNEATGAVHAGLSLRFDTIITFIDAIESANATVQGYLDTITSARTAFAAAISAKDDALIQSEAATIDATFINLIALMEDNPASYNTVTLYAGFMGEFSAKTNAVNFAIDEFNRKVNLYNTHIEIFPHIIFLSGKTSFTTWPVANYNATLPTFN
ncbi:MAG TPA: LemA family protein [Bacilli bacterium]|nr:LemA family protein [Bacilli bacterium]